MIQLCYLYDLYSNNNKNMKELLFGIIIATSSKRYEFFLSFSDGIFFEKIKGKKFKFTQNKTTKISL